MENEIRRKETVMLVVDRFRPINKWFELFVVALGSLLGIEALFVSDILDLAISFILLLPVGGLVVLGISVFYRMRFPSGVPNPSVPDTISPDYYGSVAMRHFVLFTKAMAIWFLIGFFRLVLLNFWE